MPTRRNVVSAAAGVAFKIAPGQRGYWETPQDGGIILYATNGDTPPIEPPPVEPPPVEPPPPSGETIDVRDFGAKDGQDSTDAWQRACDEAAGTGKTVVGHEGDTYILNHRGTVPMLVYRSRYCIGLRSNTKIDGRGCTFRLADQAAALAFTNLDQNGGFKDLDFRNIEYDGNRARQPNWSEQAQEIGLIGLYAFEDVTIDNLKCREVKASASRLLNGRRLRMTNCACVGCDSDAWSIGLDDTHRGPLLVYDSYLADIGAENCRQNFRNHQGNNIIISLVNSELAGVMYGKDCAGGFKIQGMSRGLIGATTEWYGSGNATANSGLKFQGNQHAQSSANRVKHITYDMVRTENSTRGEGLRFSDNEDCRVKHYIGRGNGNGVGQYPDVRICHICYRPKIDRLESYDSKGHAVHIHSSSTFASDIRDPWIGEALVQNCAGDAIANHHNGCVTEIDVLECRGVQGFHANAGGSARINIGVLRTDVEPKLGGNVNVGRRERI